MFAYHLILLTKSNPWIVVLLHYFNVQVTLYMHPQAILGKYIYVITELNFNLLFLKHGFVLLYHLTSWLDKRPVACIHLIVMQSKFRKVITTHPKRACLVATHLEGICPTTT